VKFFGKKNDGDDIMKEEFSDEELKKYEESEYTSISKKRKKTVGKTIVFSMFASIVCIVGYFSYVNNFDVEKMNKKMNKSIKYIIEGDIAEGLSAIFSDSETSEPLVSEVKTGKKSLRTNKDIEKNDKNKSYSVSLKNERNEIKIQKKAEKNDGKKEAVSKKADINDGDKEKITYNEIFKK